MASNRPLDPRFAPQISGGIRANQNINQAIVDALGLLNTQTGNLGPNPGFINSPLIGVLENQLIDNGANLLIPSRFQEVNDRNLELDDLRADSDDDDESSSAPIDDMVMGVYPFIIKKLSDRLVSDLKSGALTDPKEVRQKLAQILIMTQLERDEFSDNLAATEG